MGTVAPGNITLTKSGVIVTIGVTNVEEVWSKALTLINIPKTTSEQDIDDGANTTKIVDLLLKAQRRWNVDGEIATGLPTAGDTHNISNEKRDDLKEIFFAGQSEEGGNPKLAIMTYEGNSFNVNFEKFTVRKQQTKDERDPIDSYSVKFTAIEGEPL